MKISLCIPQYNRIKFLLLALKKIEEQSYNNIEVVISDDCSSDDTQKRIEELIPQFKYPLIYHRFEKNQGYDRNLRKSMELATGDYCFILGNDDTLWNENDIQYLVDFLKKNKLPEVGFCNFIEDHNHKNIIRRALQTGVIGHGYECAIKHYRSFSFVAGLIYKKSSFQEVNTDRFDGSVFVQMYFAAKLIAENNRFFTIEKPLVLKDIQIDNSMANSYRDTLPTRSKDYKRLDGGIPAVIMVGVKAFDEAGFDKREATYKILKGIYKFTYPYWLIDYRDNGSLIAAWGMKQGLHPTRIKEFSLLSRIQKINIYSIYSLMTLVGLAIPDFLFKALKKHVYKLAKK